MFYRMNCLTCTSKKQTNMKKWIGPMLIVLLWSASGCKENPREQLLAEGLVLYK